MSILTPAQFDAVVRIAERLIQQRDECRTWPADSVTGSRLRAIHPKTLAALRDELTGPAATPAAQTLRDAAQRLLREAQGIITRLDTEHRYISQDAQLDLERVIEAMQKALAEA